MEAKDTVMECCNAIEIYETERVHLNAACCGCPEDYIKPVLQAQAEISFKAGIRKGLILGKQIDASLLNSSELADLNERVENYLDSVKKEGRREVVDTVKDFIPKHHNLCYGVIDPHPDCKNCRWQAQLKEWGVQ